MSLSNIDMATDEHKQLANFIKHLHENLRLKANEVGAQAAWKEHVEDTTTLKEYAKCMATLANKYWEPNSNNSSSSASSRIKWTIDRCHAYFNKEKLYQRQREIDILTRLGKVAEEIKYNNNEEFIQLLDVGSCFNPFKNLENWNVLAIDLCPADESVMKCDFLNVTCGSKLSEGKEISELPSEYFDVVVFSLLLEYLPTSEQRILCCQKAFSLLKSEGILIIITPDSKPVGANAKLMKAWRFTLANLGFMRIKYEKLSHVHCIIFRKCLFKDVAKRWVDMHKDDGFDFNKMNIPQDFKNKEFNVQDCNEEPKAKKIKIDQLRKL